MTNGIRITEKNKEKRGIRSRRVGEIFHIGGSGRASRLRRHLSRDLKEGGGESCEDRSFSSHLLFAGKEGDIWKG